MKPKDILGFRQANPTHQVVKQPDSTSDPFDNSHDRRTFIGRAGAAAVAFAAAVFGVARIAEALDCGIEQCNGACNMCQVHDPDCPSDCEGDNGCWWEWDGCYECVDPFGIGLPCSEIGESGHFPCSWCGNVLCSYGEPCLIIGGRSAQADLSSATLPSGPRTGARTAPTRLTTK